MGSLVYAPIQDIREGAANGSSTQDLLRLHATSQAAFHHLKTMPCTQSAHMFRLTATSQVVRRLLLRIPVLPIRLRRIHLLLSPRLRTHHSPVRSRQSMYLNGSSLVLQMKNSMLDMCYKTCKIIAIGDSNMKVTGHRRWHHPRLFL